MRERRVILLESAERDLDEIADWLIEYASLVVAERYLDRIQQRLDKLAFASKRGSLRTEVPGLRLIGILPGVSVAFVVDDDRVIVHRILYRGRSFIPADSAEPD